MAENKQYITQTQADGSVSVSEEVIAAIVAHAATEIDGVAGLNAKPASDIVALVGKKTSIKGVKVTILDNNSIAVDCNINVRYGTSVVDVANAAQQAIISALESMTGVTISSVNVNVCGVVRQ